MNLIHRCTHGLLVAALALSLEGCILRFALQSYDSGPNGVGTRFGRLQGDSAVGECDRSVLNAGTEFACGFVGPDGFATQATFTLLGLRGPMNPWLDPLILQMPVGITNVEGSFSGIGTGNLSITTVTGPLQVDATRQLVPEAGTKFVIVDFPGETPTGGPGDYHFQLTYTAPAGVPSPLSIKPVFAAKVTVNGQTFYPPLLPCTTNMAAVPAITLPTANMSVPVNLAPFMGQSGCNAATYNVGTASTATVVEYYNATLDHYFVTWLENEQANLDAGNTPTRWERTGHSFMAYTAAQTGTSPVCRYYIPPDKGDSHFLGRGTAECDATGLANPTFILEAAQFLHMFLPIVGVCPEGTAQVHRAFSNRVDANHRYMTDIAILDLMVSQGWLAEGDGPQRVVMCAPGPPAPVARR